MCQTKPDQAPRLCLSLPLLVSKTLILILILALAHFTICDGVSATSIDSVERLELGGMASRVCKGGSCVGTEDEGDEMDSESNRRLLMMQPRRYVSYDTLRKDLVPCERPGASYYNCRSGGVANPYTRGCNVIAGCARSIRDIKT